jgi:hypothetical protein
VDLRERYHPCPPNAGCLVWAASFTPASETPNADQPYRSVMLPPRNNAAHLEWWHYQYRHLAAPQEFSTLAEECGYSKLVLGTPEAGAVAATGEPVHRGLGFTPGELDDQPWPGESERNERPSNSDPESAEEVEDGGGDIE